MVSRGLTLLEAVIALAILAMVAGAVLEMRAAALRESARIADMQRGTREVASIFRMITTNTLGQPTLDTRSSLPVWQGQHLGEPFRVERRAIRVPNPARTVVDAPLAAEVRVFQYTITYGPTEEVFLWHR